MIQFRQSVGETCPCTSVQRGFTQTVSTYLNAFVYSAVVGRVCQCKLSAKYGCSATTAQINMLSAECAEPIQIPFCSSLFPGDLCRVSPANFGTKPSITPLCFPTAVSLSFTLILLNGIAHEYFGFEYIYVLGSVCAFFKLAQVQYDILCKTRFVFCLLR